MEFSFFIFCDDCSKSDECDQRFSPGCDNHLGYALTQRDKMKEDNDKTED